MQEKNNETTLKEYIAPLGFDVIDFSEAGAGKGKGNCKTDCR